ncbi:hypothetical protein INT47_001543 [Mucor saturninus]|uniref:Equilibrative nucleoside transporter 1 n=1 Tax=Mucor saturninus TaxID=64648 RepID=A0A8H7QTS8_9FUNG|nr:hypothetical protein INT47_001543 [Mucor saturninus]
MDEQIESSTLYWVYFAYGIAMLLPWNVFITASDYFSVLFSGSGHETDFMSYFSAFSNVSNLLSLSLFLWLRQKKHMGNVDVLIPLSINLAIFLFYTVTSWAPNMIAAHVYFRLTVFCMSVAGTTTSLLQLTVFADASQLSPKYMQAVMSGQGIAGVSVSLFSLMTTVFGGDGTIFYFLGALVVTLVSMLGRLHQQKTHKYQLVEDIDLSLEPVTEPALPLTSILKRSKRYIFTVVYIYIITLSIFPALTSQFGWRAVDGVNTKQVFMSLHFLIFNLGDWVGRTLPIWRSCQVRSSRIMMVYALLRTLFLPLFLIVTVEGNVVFLAGVFLLAVTNGWLTSLVFMMAPVDYEMETKPVVASVMSYFLVIGLALGGLCSFLY